MQLVLGGLLGGRHSARHEDPGSVPDARSLPADQEFLRVLVIAAVPGARAAESESIVTPWQPVDKPPPTFEVRCIPLGARARLSTDR